MGLCAAIGLKSVTAFAAPDVPKHGQDEWKAPPLAARKTNPAPADEKTIGLGKTFFTVGCVACHGEKGKGDGPAALALERDGQKIVPGNLSDPMMWQHTDGELFWKLSEGKSPMPSFAEAFSDEQRWQIVNYIRTLASKPSSQTVATQIPAAPSSAKPIAETTAEKSPADAAKDPAVSEKYVTREEYEKLLRELASIKAMLKAADDQKLVQAKEAEETTSGFEKELKDVKSLATASFPGSTKSLLSGYGSAGFIAQDHGGTKQFSASFNPIFLWKLSDRLLFEGELEAQLEGHDTSLALEIAQISYLLNDYMTIGAGKFLNPMNYFVERQHMNWVNKLPDKPLAVYDGLLSEADVGFQLRGGVPIGRTKLGYAFFVANAPELRTDPSSFGASDLGTLEFNNFNNVGNHVAVGGRIGFFPIPELEFGYGFQYADVTPSGSSSHVASLLQSVDLSYVYDSDRFRGTVNFKAQWVWSHVNNFTYDPHGTMGGPFSFNNNRNGGYLQLAYRPSHVANGFVKNLEPVFRFDKMNQARTLTGADETRYTVGLNYWLGSSTVFKTAYEFDRQSGPNADPHNSVLVQFVTGF